MLNGDLSKKTLIKIIAVPFLLVLIIVNLGMGTYSVVQAQQETDSTSAATSTQTPTGTPNPPDQSLSQPHVPDELIVRFLSGVDKKQQERILQGVGVQVRRKIPALQDIVLQVPPEKLEHVLSTLSNNPNIEFVEPNYIATAVGGEPDDPHYPEQWGLDAIGAQDAWGVTTGAEDVIIAIVDTGVDLTHPDLDDKIVTGWDFVSDDPEAQDDHGHGTHVAGIAAAESDNGIGVAGVSWGARIMPVKVLDSSASGSYADVAAGIVYAVDNGAQVINLSLGGIAPSLSLQAAIEYAYEGGVVVVAASGNMGAEGVMYPAAYPEVIAVGAVNQSLERAGYSSYGPELDLVAPGVDIISTCLGGKYCTMSGTSMAAPYVSGAWVFLLQNYSEVLLPDLIQMQMEGTQDLGVFGYDELYGHGLVIMKIDGLVVRETDTPAVSPTPTHVPAGKIESAEKAIEIRIDEFNSTPNENYRYKIIAIQEQGDWALGMTSKAMKLSGEIIPTEGFIAIAKRDSSGGWQGYVREDNDIYDELLDQVPDSLLDAQSKDYIRTAGQSKVTTEATVSGHYLPWPAPEGALVTQNYSDHGLGQIDFVPDVSDILSTKSGNIVYVNDSHPDWIHSIEDIRYSYYNNVVVIQHGPNEFTIYLHLKYGSIPSWVRDGCPGGNLGMTCSLPIDRGEKIGEMGTTGYSSGPHIHLSTARSFYVDSNNPDWLDEDGDGDKTEYTYTAFTSEHISADFIEHTYDQLYSWPYGPKIFSQNDPNDGGGGSNPGDTVTLFEHYHHDENSTQYGWHDPGLFNLPDYLNDKSSSIWIADGWSVRVFEHADGNGGKWCFDSSDLDFTNDTYDNDVAVNDTVSSIEIYNSETCPSTGGDDTVTLFEHIEFLGTQYGWHDTGVFNLPDYLDRNGSSIWIKDGWSARVYDGLNGSGSSHCSNSTDSDFTNDTLLDGQPVNDNFSSIELYNQDLCPATDTTPPTGAMTSPPGDSYQSGSIITLQATASDTESGVQRVDFYGWSNEPWSNQQWILLGTDNAATYEMGWDVTAIDEGGVWVSIDVVDNEGNHSDIVWEPDWVYFTIDKTPPESSVYSLPGKQSETEFVVRWWGYDSYTPVDSLVYDVQFQIGCSGDWLLWNSTSSTSATFNGEVGQSYCFRSRARDLAGNTEAWPATPDTMTSIIAPPDNDDRSGALPIDTLPYTNTQSTSGATLEADEPTYTCGYNNASSVWYRYTPALDGQFSVDTIGSDYDTVLHVFEEPGDGSLPLVGCNDDAEGLQSKVIFNVTADSSYLIGVTHYGGGSGGSLTLNFSEQSCPASALCVSVKDATGANAWYPKITMFDGEGILIAEGYGGSDGYVVIDPVSTGTFKLVASARELFIVAQGVNAPGTYSMTAQGLPDVEIIVRNSDGVPLDAEVVFAESEYGNGYVGYTYVGEPLVVYASQGTYDITAIDYNDRYLLSLEDHVISTPGQTIALDASMMPTDTLTIDWDGFTQGTFSSYAPFTNYWFGINVADGQSLTLSVPEEYYSVWTEVRFVDIATDDEWLYRFRHCCYTTGTGGVNTNLTVGGTFSASAQSLSANYLPGQIGELSTTVVDAYDNNMVTIWHWDDDATASALDSQFLGQLDHGSTAYFREKNGQDYEVDEVIGGLPSRGDLDGVNVDPPLTKSNDASGSSEISAQGAWQLITPTYQVTDAIGEVISGSLTGSGLYAYYEFAIPDPANEGVWEGQTIVDFGPYQAAGIDETNFNVITLEIPNDDIDNATVIDAMPVNLSQEIWAASVAADDPIFPCTDLQHYRSVWFQYTPSADGTLSIDTEGSDYDTVLAIWTGERGGLSSVACNDDIVSGEITHSSVQFSVFAGTTYYVEIAGYGVWSSGTLHLNGIFEPTIIKTELLVNGSMEIVVPSAWKGSQLTTVDGSDCVVSHGGSCSLTLTGSLSGQTKMLYYGLPGFTGSAGDEFTLSYFNRRQDVGGAGALQVRVTIRYTDGTMQNFSFVPGVGTADWQEYTHDFTAAKDYEWGVIRLIYSKPNGTLWYDDMSLMR